jgi:hypothetical protein
MMLSNLIQAICCEFSILRRYWPLLQPPNHLSNFTLAQQLLLELPFPVAVATSALVPATQLPLRQLLMQTLRLVQ